MQQSNSKHQSKWYTYNYTNTQVARCVSCVVHSGGKIVHRQMIIRGIAAVTSGTRKSETTGSRMPSVRTLTPHFNTPPQRKILIIPTPQPCHKSKLEQRRTRRVRKSAWLWRTEPNSTHRSRIYTINTGFQKSTLCDRARGMQSRQKAHQALPPAMEDALKKWALRMDSQGFPPRLDILGL